MPSSPAPPAVHGEGEPRGAPFVDRGPRLPARYPGRRLVAMLRGDGRLYAYWEHEAPDPHRWTLRALDEAGRPVAEARPEGAARSAWLDAPGAARLVLSAPGLADLVAAPPAVPSGGRAGWWRLDPRALLPAGPADAPPPGPRLDAAPPDARSR